MALEVDQGIECLFDDALLIDDKCYPFAEHPQKPGADSIEPMYGFVGIAQQSKWQFPVGDKELMRGNRVGADSDDLGARFHEILVAISKGTCFLRATVGFVLGVEIQHDGSGFECFGEGEFVAVLVHEGEVGGDGADRRCCHILGKSVLDSIISSLPHCNRRFAAARFSGCNS